MPTPAHYHKVQDSSSTCLVVPLGAGPTIYFNRYFAESGGLIAYGVDYAELFRLAAGYVDQVLKGAKPAELPIQLPSKFDLAVNTKTAEALGIKVPPFLLAAADEVID